MWVAMRRDETITKAATALRRVGETAIPAWEMACDVILDIFDGEYPDVAVMSLQALCDRCPSTHTPEQHDRLQKVFYRWLKLQDTGFSMKCGRVEFR